MAKIREDIEGVVVAVGATGEPVILRAGDDVPDGVTVGDHVLVSSDDGSDEEGAAGGGTGLASAPDLQVPPRGGAGSGADAWRAYAAAAATAKGLEIEIPADANRDDIIEALKGADIPVE